MKHRQLVVFAGLAVGIAGASALTGCAGDKRHAAASTSPSRVIPDLAPSTRPSRIEPLLAAYLEDQRSISKFFNITWSENRMQRLDDLAAAQIESLSKLDFAALTHNEKVDALAFRNHLRNARNYAALERTRLAELAPLLAFRSAIVTLEESRWRMERPDPRAVALELETIAEQAKEMRHALESREQTPSPATALRAAAAVSSLRRSLSQFVEYSQGYVPEFSWWVKKPWESAGAALNDYAKFLRENIARQRGTPADPLVGDPIGRDTLLADLQNEMIAYTPDELIAIADREFTWCEQEMKKAAAEMGLADDWRQALERVKDGHVAPGGQADMVSEKARAAIAFVKSRDLVTVPPLAEELWRLQMLSPQGQKTLPFAAYNDQHMLVAYPTDDMSTADKVMAMRGNNRHFLHIVVPHELIPGHHLQRFISDRSLPYRNTFSTPFFVEGWALYWEFKLWDLNWGATPEDRIGMLFWRMHRCARITVSLKYHLGEMTPPQMIDFLVTRVGHERENATAEVRRFIGDQYSPLYQCGYMVGGLALRRLHDEAVLHGGLAEKSFNDAVLRGNTLPIELVRAEILNLPLEWSSEPAWKFADEPLR